MVLWALSPVSSTWYSEPWVPSLPRGIVSLESRLYHVVLQRFYSFPKTSGKIPGPHNLLFNGHRGLMPGDKAAGTWRWKSTPHVAPRIKQEYSFTFSCQRVTVKHHNWRQQKVNLEGTCGIGGEAPHILNCSVRCGSLPTHTMPRTDRMAVRVGLRVILDCRRRTQILAPANNSNRILCSNLRHMVSTTGD